MSGPHNGGAGLAVAVVLSGVGELSDKKITQFAIDDPKAFSLFWKEKSATAFNNIVHIPLDLKIHLDKLSPTDHISRVFLDASKVCLCEIACSNYDNPTWTRSLIEQSANLHNPRSGQYKLMQLADINIPEDMWETEELNERLKIVVALCLGMFIKRVSTFKGQEKKSLEEKLTKLSYNNVPEAVNEMCQSLSLIEKFGISAMRGEFLVASTYLRVCGELLKLI
eukprot:TRINITY_DN1252_c0_g1_i2.p1 TRINITY_DN1252_c0_g1~~TRINITY_DN1252_c0_g1_i2.p1  ORF type:complete len:224 (+),score=21.88 TRINITY_DN1252_c0_g1_i2:382-1053(+)